MLTEFRVSNFKNFKDELVFKLDNTKNYEFSNQAIKDNIINTCLIYGMNGSGKSNLGLALFDITLNLTDKQRNLNFYKIYLNLESNKPALFYYKFKFENDYVEYRYEKSGPEDILREELLINDQRVVYYDYTQHKGQVSLKGTETLNNNLSENSISFVKYISSNAVLTDERERNIMGRFMSFVNNMLLFSSLESNHYQGFKIGSDSLAKSIIENGKLKDFESFLRKVKIEYKLVEGEIDGEPAIFCDFKGKQVNFFSIASKGTTSLTLFYYWTMYMEKVSFLFIDEFDAFYHNSLAIAVVKEVLEKTVQTVITTHNTSIMTNDLLRPDCYFELEDGNINSFAFLTDKDLRKAHNIEKMYRANSFKRR